MPIDWIVSLAKLFTDAVVAVALFCASVAGYISDAAQWLLG